MSRKQTPPLSEEEIQSTYRNEFYTINTRAYFNHYDIDDTKSKIHNNFQQNLIDKKEILMNNKYETEINLDNFVDVKKFVETANKLPCDVELLSGKYIVDGKSIMGVLSLDLSKNVTLKVEEEYIDAFWEAGFIT